MKRWLIALALAAGLGTAGWLSLDRDLRTLIATGPTDTDILFWTDDQRDAGFRALDKLGWVVDSRVIARGNSVRPLPAGEPLALDLYLDAYIEQQRVAGLVVLVDGRVVLERYARGFGPDGRWTSFSVAKSLTSTLVGAALQDGAIRSLDDRVSAYVPDLAGSAYDDVTIRQLLTMTSGVAWSEDYGDPQSDVARFNAHRPEAGVDTTVSYMRGLPRAAPAGEQWLYKTGETNLIGVVVSSATGKPLAQYLSERIWAPFGMEQDATWLLGSTGHEISGCCIQAGTRDMARFGLFVLDGGRIGGEQVVPDDWFDMATTKQADIGEPGRGYGFQWWTYDDGTFAAQGIFGQGIFIDPARRLVIATNGNWPIASSDELWAGREAFYRAVQAAVEPLQPR
ncbi:beta-lactamase family protein [Altererythrobacter sp. KTW20L]|uniref:serine hydrolase domain-containing protein n=1 Tax=Altererythrobacter sp. KTW20L TaxID=2942210 RepID=UPI0020BD9E4F|nr:serine hydrolase [Altererythrobacter sp. KTW20L]MCL6252116.1 beta-lactamase family protein [Altererythrobacter sp. KTW20L]